jgi:hypothetical protein
MLTKIVPVLTCIVCASIAVTACASNDTEGQVARERMACAQLGLAPGSMDFDSCFQNLDAAMFEATSPAHQ